MPSPERVFFDGAVYHVYNRLARGESLLGEQWRNGVTGTFSKGHQNPVSGAGGVFCKEVPGTVNGTVNQYAPQVYTHQEPPLTLTYPGTFDADGDGMAETVDRAWLESLLGTIDDFVADHGSPVAVNEMGVMRWEVGAVDYLSYEIDLLEARGLNHAAWAWEPSWPPWADEVTAFNFRLGPDPADHSESPGNALEAVLKGAWSRNIARPVRHGIVRRAGGRVRPDGGGK